MIFPYLAGAPPLFMLFMDIIYIAFMLLDKSAYYYEMDASDEEDFN